jgi:hypothetical protein
MSSFLKLYGWQWKFHGVMLISYKSNKFKNQHTKINIFFQLHWILNSHQQCYIRRFGYINLWFDDRKYPFTGIIQSTRHFYILYCILVRIKQSRKFSFDQLISSFYSKIFRNKMCQAFEMSCRLDYINKKSMTRKFDTNSNTNCYEAIWMTVKIKIHL